jgi:hypothetical protein
LAVPEHGWDQLAGNGGALRGLSQWRRDQNAATELEEAAKESLQGSTRARGGGAPGEARPGHGVAERTAK